jgi:hypothetical protein
VNIIRIKPVPEEVIGNSELMGKAGWIRGFETTTIDMRATIDRTQAGLYPLMVRPGAHNCGAEASGWTSSVWVPK